MRPLARAQEKVRNSFKRSQKRYEAAVAAATEHNESGPLLNESSTSVLGLQAACEGFGFSKCWVWGAGFTVLAGVWGSVLGIFIVGTLLRRLSHIQDSTIFRVSATLQLQTCHRSTSSGSNV